MDAATSAFTAGIGKHGMAPHDGRITPRTFSRVAGKSCTLPGSTSETHSGPRRVEQRLDIPAEIVTFRKAPVWLPCLTVDHGCHSIYQYLI